MDSDRWSNFLCCLARWSSSACKARKARKPLSLLVSARVMGLAGYLMTIALALWKRNKKGAVAPPSHFLLHWLTRHFSALRNNALCIAASLPFGSPGPCVNSFVQFEPLIKTLAWVDPNASPPNDSERSFATSPGSIIQFHCRCVT